ncbi:DUF937 domain-containing protein [Clostridiaceae bacterium OttesenSCG-928-D20]|nr:DUF937 domain-containing protein [Clostridiaceae bacterium OttesenSCG-928-D20]
MASLLDSLMGSLLGSDATKEIAKKSGASSDQVQNIVTSALPLLLQSMASNASDPKEAESLNCALCDHAAHDQSVTSQIKNADLDDGSKILKHLLGSKEKDVEKNLAKSSGLQADQVQTVLSALAPALLSQVGKETKASKNTGSDIGSLITGLVTGGNSDASPLDGILKFAMKNIGGEKKEESGGGDLLSGIMKLMTGK